MPKPEIEEFIQILVSEVRDNAIAQSDVLVDPECNSDTSKRLRNLKNKEDYIKELIPEIVDTAIFYILNAIDNSELPITFKSGNGNKIDLSGDGELAGWYAAGDFIKKYSKQRYYDDLSDLTLG